MGNPFKMEGNHLCLYYLSLGAPLKIHFEQKETKETKIKNKESPGLTAGLKSVAKNSSG
jgi:hypothetical protein